MMGQNKKIILLSGPTATGKTSTSIFLAKSIGNLEIVNFDSLLFYRELNIGTAKPGPLERQGVGHHMIDICSAKEPMNASHFIKKAQEVINSLHKSNIVPILVGGSAFYIRALIKGMYEGPRISQEIKDELEAIYQQKGIGPIREFLKQVDPVSYKGLHENDHYRIMRAAEYYKQSGRRLSEEKSRMDEENPYDFTKTRYADWKLLHLYLDIPKEEHWQIIQNRTEQMLRDGLIEEARGLLAAGFSGKEKPLTSIGYKETFAYLEGEFKDQDQLKERIAISTRQLAKAQRTFFKKITPKLEFHPLRQKKDILRACQDFLESEARVRI